MVIIKVKAIDWRYGQKVGAKVKMQFSTLDWAIGPSLLQSWIETSKFCNSPQMKFNKCHLGDLNSRPSDA